MQAVSLYDELTLRTSDDGRVTVHCDHPGLPDAEDNLVVHAAHAARAAWGVRRGVRVDLVKGIPVGGGLGGGSSDAAVTLLALADLWGVEAQGAELEAMAAGLGSDVAFFLSGGTALCEGRGERVSPLACGGTFHYVLVLPDYGVSTERVYGAPRSGLTEQTRADNNIRSALDRGDTALLARSLRNDLQGPALTLCPDLAHLHERVTGLAGSCGLAGVLLSGSGSTLLAVERATVGPAGGSYA